MQCHVSSYKKKKCDSVDKIQRAFWWGQQKDEKKINLMKWETLKQNKGNGRMGFRDLHAFNKTLLAK